MKKLNTNEAVSIVLSANELYVPYLATTIESIIENSSRERTYNFYILHRSIKESSRNELKSMIISIDNISMEFIDMSELVSDKKFFIGGKPGLTAETYFRLYIPRILSNIKKVVYLDCDVVVEKDIAKLFDVDLTNKLFAASQDYCSIGKYYMGDKEQINYWNNELQLKNIEEYFCAGVMVMNLDKMRDIGVNTIIKLATERDWKKHDQDVLNILGRGNTLILHPQWDVLKAFDEVQYIPDNIMTQVQEAEKDPSIIHYSSSYKPWNTGFIERFDRFWKYAANSPFFFDIIKRLNNKAYQCYVIKNFAKDKTITYTSVPNDVFLSYGPEDIFLGKLSDNYTKIEHLAIEKKKLILRGRTMLMSLDNQPNIKVFAKLGDKKYACRILSGNYSEQKLGLDAYFGVGFDCEIDLTEIKQKTILQFICEFENYIVIKKNISFGVYAPLSTRFINSYYISDGFVVATDKKSIIIDRKQNINVGKLEKAFLQEIKKVDLGNFNKIKIARGLSRFVSRISHKEIWLLSDRANKADDNGEALFRYLKKNKPKGVKVYFVLDKRSADFARMKKFGSVVNSLSWRHKWLFLRAKLNISSQADANTIQPFRSATDYYRDLIKNKFVFLQHGIIKEDMSATYNKTNQNMAMFVTAAYPEYLSIVNNPQYGCDKNTVKLTGLPRHDRLYHDEKKIITLMPTWRKYLFKHSIDYIGVWEPKEGFSSSYYCKFYNDLMNNTKLLNALKEYDYKLCFMPHPNVQGAIKYFKKSENVEFLPIDTPYSKIFAESKLVITDRSSAIMDFAYLRKPVLYCLFDDDKFMQGQHVYVKGYFDYEKHGFGEVSYDLNSTVDNIISYIKNDCELKDKYRKRMDQFFAYNDHLNCKRTLQEINKLR